MDVGGGNGSNLIQILESHSKAKGIVFESPSVCEIANKNILKHGMSERLKTHPGNCFADEFPGPCDCLVFCHFLTIWSLEQNEELLSKAYHHLPKEGAVIIFNMMQRNDEKGPLSSAMGAPYFLTIATGKGMLYKWKEYDALLRKVGFSKIKMKKLPLDHGLIIGTK